MLAVVAAPDSPGHISAQEVCDWAAEYLQDQDEERARLPDLAGEPHWNLWMNDARYEDAVFVVLVFLPAGLEFFCGRGDSFQVRHFCEHDFPDDLLETYEAMRGRFTIPAILRIDRRTAERWLGRSW
jgi:hypothetical protein